MSEEIPMPNDPMTVQEEDAAANLSTADLAAIDEAILTHASTRWLKVARVVMWTEREFGCRWPDLSYRFYARRLIHLIERRQLEVQGNPEYMRFSEVRIPGLSP